MPNAAPTANVIADVAIVGAGVIGLLTARSLAAAGLRVVVVDAGTAAKQASWAGGGILSPLPPWKYPDSVNMLSQRSQLLYERLCDELHDETEIDPEYIVSGMRVLGDQRIATDWLNSWHRHGEFSNSGELLLPYVAQLRTPRFGRALRQSTLDNPNIDLLENQPVSGLLVQNGRCAGVRLKNGNVLRSGAVVVAAGAWSASLLPANEWQPAIAPVRGQMLLFKAEQGLLNEIILSGRRYLIPRKDGRILIGSTLEHVGFDQKTTREAAEELKAAAIGLLPELASAPVEHHWAGLRPGTPNSIPYIGRHPSIQGLHYNSGHYRNGVVLAPASAELLTDSLLNQKAHIDPSAFLPENRQTAALA